MQAQIAGVAALLYLAPPDSLQHGAALFLGVAATNKTALLQIRLKFPEGLRKAVLQLQVQFLSLKGGEAGRIHDLRTDSRIDFVGGIRGLGELSARVDSSEMEVASALYPVSMKQLTDIADSGNIMPPKTTWFEPKLQSGLAIHTLD